MRNKRIVLLVALFAVPSSAATHAVLPGCCTSVLYAMTVLNGTTGHVEHEFTSPGIASPGFGYGVSVTISKDGKHAFVLSNLYPAQPPQSIRVDRINLSTGEITALATTTDALGGSLCVDPQSGLIYVTYNATTSHVQVINPVTSAVTLDVPLTCKDVLPNGGTVYCSTSSGVTVLKASTLQPIGSVTLSGGGGSLALSPDGSVLYATSPVPPFFDDVNVAFVDTATLQVTQSVAIGSSVQAFAISPDGSQLYLGTRTALVMLNTATLAQTAVPIIPGYPLAVAANGTLYWLSGSDVVLFDPATQTVAATYPSPESISFALDPVTDQLAFLAGGSYPSMVSATAAEPSQTIVTSAPTGELPLSGAYDRNDNLILLPNYLDDVDVLDAVTLQTKGYIQLPGYTSQVLFADQGYAFITNLGFFFEVLQFDPVSLQTGSNVQVPFPTNDNQVALVQPAIHGSQLFVPYNFDCGGCYTPPYWNVGIAVIDTQGMTLETQFPIPHGITINGFAIAPGGDKGYVAVEYGYTGPYKLLEIDLQTGVILRAASLQAGNLTISPDGSTLYAMLASGLGTIGTQTLTVTNSAPGLTVGPFSLTPDGDYIYAAIADGVDIIATASLTVVGSIASTTQPSQPILVEY